MPPNDYATVEDVKAELGVDTPLDDSYDGVLARIITQVSRLVDRVTGREPGAYAVEEDSVRYFDGRASTELWIGELATVPSEVAVAVMGDPTTYTVWDAADVVCWPYNAEAEGRPYLRLDIAPGSRHLSWLAGRRGIRITGRFGYSTVVPGDIERAVIIQAVRSFKRAQQAYQDVGAISELGQLRYVKALDPDVQLIVDAYRRFTV